MPGTPGRSAKEATTYPESDPSLSADERALLATALRPQFRAWLDQMRHIGGCAQPIYLTGSTTVRDRDSRTLISAFSSASLPYGLLAVACENRRATRCPSCSWLHQGDTYQLIVSGLAGGKGVPAAVSQHPRVFATLTAPSFGAVHRATDPSNRSDRCRSRRSQPRCEHGRAGSCLARHSADDPLLGQPLCPDCYDYTAAVLWNAHTGRLWDRFAWQVRYSLASSGHVPRQRLREHLRIAFAKVAEYQRRGSIHLHAVIRLDGAAGPDDPPPEWADTAALISAINHAAASIAHRIPAPDPDERIVLRFGTQVEAHAISSGDDSAPLTDGHVASYIAKYVTKPDVGGLVLDSRLKSPAHIDAAPVTPHARTLMRAAWSLGGLDQYAYLRLRAWAHQLGYRGHITTKSRRYSTTYTALRQARADYLSDLDGTGFDEADTVTYRHWVFDHQGHTPGEALWAAGIAAGLADAREAAREARADGAADDGRHLG